MKKNKNTFLLLTCVLAIWGFLGFKIVSALNSSPKEVQAKMAQLEFSPSKPKVKDTFSIAVNYRDPFLGTVPRTKSKQGTLKKTTPKAPKRNIIYTGFITDSNSKKRIFFVTIDGQQYMMGQRDKIQKVKLVSGNKSAIQVSYGGTVHKIPITQ